jgi:hypothetical protein
VGSAVRQGSARNGCERSAPAGVHTHDMTGGCQHHGASFTAISLITHQAGRARASLESAPAWHTGRRRHLSAPGSGWHEVQSRSEPARRLRCQPNTQGVGKATCRTCCWRCCRPTPPRTCYSLPVSTQWPQIQSNRSAYPPDRQTGALPAWGRS